MTPELAKLAPFALRSGIVVRGRGKLKRLGTRLAFVIVTSDASEGTYRQMSRWVPCPIIRDLTSADVRTLFALENTKVIGFTRSPVATSLWTALRPNAAETDASANPTEDEAQT